MPDPLPTTIVTVSASSLSTGRRDTDPPLTAAVDHTTIIVKVVQPAVLITVRGLRVFVQTLLGALSAGMVGILTAPDFWHLLVKCASISVAAGVVCVLQNVGELLAKIDQSHPTLVG